MNIITIIFKLAKKLPGKLSIIFCQIILLIYLFWHKTYRQEINLNYQRIFKRKRRFWLRQALKLGHNLALTLQFGKNKKTLDKIEIYGENILCDLLKEKQKAIVVTFHYGLWELLPQIFQKLGYETYISVGEKRNRFFDELNKFRSQNGVKIVKTVAEMRTALSKSLTRPRLLGFVLDNTSKTRGFKLFSPHWHNFSVLRTPFILAKSFKLPILAMFCFHQKNRLVVAIHAVRNSQALGNQLLSYIKSKPEEWIFWGKRWDW